MSGADDASSADQVAEDALERVVGRARPRTGVTPALARDPRQGPGERARSRRSGRRRWPSTSSAPKTDASAISAAASAPVVGRADRERVRPVGHQPADRAEVAGRGQPPGVDDQHRVGERARPPRGCATRTGSSGPAAAIDRSSVDHVQPLARVHAVERLVEQQDRRVVDERAGELGPLAHALGVRADRAVGGVGQVDRGDRPGRGGVRIGDALEPRVEPRELAARSGSAWTASRSGTRPTWRYIVGSPPGRRAVDHGRVPADGASRPAIRCRSVDLPAPFGPSRPVTPGPSANEMSLTATTLPYQRETWSTSRRGGAAVGGARRPAARPSARPTRRVDAADRSCRDPQVAADGQPDAADDPDDRGARRTPSRAGRATATTGLSESDPKSAAFVPSRMSAGLNRMTNRARSPARQRRRRWRR